ncbi:MAG TPA: hypothetical protein VGV93_00920 [Acidimicrobiales bacterium]|nr:hypothetical protein [Acidimicrobiales bacterium]
MMRPRLYLLIFAVASGLAACSSTSDAPTARFTILGYPEDGGSVPGSRYEGEGDFASGEVIYTLMVEGEPAIERREIGTSTYVRTVGEDDYYESDQTPESLAVRTVRNGLVASPDAVEHLRSIADEVTEVGREEVRGTKTTHYRGVVHLAEMGAPREYDRFPIEVWIDDSGRTRRYSQHPLGSTETIVWEFYDFGVSVEDLVRPPPEKVRG